MELSPTAATMDTIRLAQREKNHAGARWIRSWELVYTHRNMFNLRVYNWYQLSITNIICFQISMRPEGDEYLCRTQVFGEVNNGSCRHLMDGFCDEHGDSQPAMFVCQGVQVNSSSVPFRSCKDGTPKNMEKYLVVTG